MNEEQMRAEVLAVLSAVAPEANVREIVAEQAFRDQMDLDSIDFLEFVLALEKRLQVRIPEVDYPRLASLDGAVDYLRDRLAETAPARS